MKLFLFKRILMNAADGSPGGGSSPAPTSPTNPPAQGGAQPQYVTKDDLKSFADEMRNGLFADARRAGMLGKDSKTKQPQRGGDEDPPSSSPATAPDPMKFRELDRAVTRLGFADKLDDTAFKRMERAFIEEAPTDAAAWVKGFLGGFGLAQSAPATAAEQKPTTTVTDPKRPPVSNAGGVPTSQVPIEERSLIGMSESDINHLVKTKGIQWVRQTLYRQLRGVRVQVGPNQ
jgi:hypothetical protein